jgi:hypothetical protein
MIKPGPKREDILFFRKVPPNLKAQFKAYCARRGITMQDMLVKLMRNCVLKDEQVVGKPQEENGNE